MVFFTITLNGFLNEQLMSQNVFMFLTVFAYYFQVLFSSVQHRSKQNDHSELSVSIHALTSTVLPGEYHQDNDINVMRVIIVCFVYTQWYSTVFTQYYCATYSHDIIAQYCWKYFFKIFIRSEQNSFQSCDWSRNSSITEAQACQFYICFKPWMLNVDLCTKTSCLWIVCLINKVWTIYWSSNITFLMLLAILNIFFRVVFYRRTF